MDEHLNISYDRAVKKAGLFNRFKNMDIIDYLKHPTSLIFFSICSICIAFLIGKYGMGAVSMIVAAMIGIPTVICIIVFPQFGVTALLVSAYMLFFPGRIGINTPLGTLMDGLQGLLIFGFILQYKTDKRPAYFKGGISTCILIWIIYNLLEVANPTAESRLAWIFTIRSVALIMIMYFIFMYTIRTVSLIKLIFKIWIGMAFFAAIYAFKQEHFGFNDVEEAYLHSDPNIASLLFIDGHWRKFSIFSDPVAFSYNMVMASILCICIIMMPTIKVWKKIVLGIIACFMLLTMLYSGTRGAFVLLPVALILLAVLKYNKKVLKFTIVAGIFIAILIFMPTGNQTLVRFQSAFKPSNDISFQARKFNQKRIQPYIQSHPMGGGLGSVGSWGERFSPNSYLAHFPPDSGYVRVAVEQGWIGILIFCTLVFTILKTGINNYYTIRDPELKTYCLAMTLIIFAYNIGNYPQEALVQYPSNIFFFFEAALINITARLDNEKWAN